MNITIGVPWNIADTFIFLSYFFLMVWIGLRFSKRANKGMSEYFLSGRSLTLPLVMGTMMTAWYDGYSVVGVAEWAMTTGIAAMIVYVIPVTISRIPFAIWIAPFVRGKIPEDCMTVPDLLEYLYDKKAKVLGAIAVLAGVLYNGVNFLCVAQLVHLIFGLPNWTAVLVSGVTIGAYVFASGLWAVTVTDVFQLGYMSISAGIAIIYAMNMVGGFEGIFAALNPVAPALFEPTGQMAIPQMLAWALLGMSIYTEPVMYQRFSASDSAQTAKLSFLFCIPMWLTFSSAMVLLGFCAKTMYPDMQSYEAFWNLIFNALPGGLRGLFAAGLVAAVMSTVSSSLLVQSAALVKDIYGAFRRTPMTDEQMMKANKYAMLILLAFSMISTQAWLSSILNGLLFVTGFQVAGLFVPMVVGMFYKKRTATAGWFTILFGFALYLLWQFGLTAPFGIPANDVTWFCSLVVYFVMCKLTYKGKNEINGGELR